VLNRGSRIGWNTHRRPRGGAFVLLAFLLLWRSPIDAQQRPKVEPPKFNPTELTQTLNSIIEAQRSLAASISDLRDRLAAAERGTAELRDAVQQNQATAQSAIDGAVEQIKGMREEVRGLYVESSGIKGDIAQLGTKVEGLDQSLGSFRLSSGIVVAVIIVLQVALVGLMFRGRG